MEQFTCDNPSCKKKLTENDEYIEIEFRKKDGTSLKVRTCRGCGLALSRVFSSDWYNKIESKDAEEDAEQDVAEKGKGSEFFKEAIKDASSDEQGEEDKKAKASRTKASSKKNKIQDESGWNSSRTSYNNYLIDFGEYKDVDIAEEYKDIDLSKFNSTRERLRFILDDFGRENIVKLYLSGVSMGTIGNVIDISSNILRKWATDANLPKINRGGRSFRKLQFMLRDTSEEASKDIVKDAKADDKFKGEHEAVEEELAEKVEDVQKPSEYEQKPSENEQKPSEDEHEAVAAVSQDRERERDKDEEIASNKTLKESKKRSKRGRPKKYEKILAEMEDEPKEEYVEPKIDANGFKDFGDYLERVEADGSVTRRVRVNAGRDIDARGSYDDGHETIRKIAKSKYSTPAVAGLTAVEKQAIQNAYKDYTYNAENDNIKLAEVKKQIDKSTVEVVEYDDTIDVSMTNPKKPITSKGESVHLDAKIESTELLENRVGFLTDNCDGCGLWDKDKKKCKYYEVNNRRMRKVDGMCSHYINTREL